MLLKKCVKNRRRLKIVLLLAILALIAATIVILNSASASIEPRSSIRAQEALAQLPDSLPLVLQSQQERVPILPEKYDEQKVRTRLIADKIKYLTQRQQLQAQQQEDAGEVKNFEVTTTGVHIFYSAPVQWYKSKRALVTLPSERQQLQANGTGMRVGGTASHILNTAFYPAFGLYKPTISLMQKHFENIRNCGIGVLILTYTGGSSNETQLYNQILTLAPTYNLSVTFELSLELNQSRAYLHEQLMAMRAFMQSEGFFRVHSLSRRTMLPVLYISHAYKLGGETTATRSFCSSHLDNERRTLDAFFVGHIRLKAHAEHMRRLCFDGFYSKLPSNGATYASTWKNWSYLKSFAQTYKMLFVPTVGPGFAERNKFPRHGDIQRHRSNGRYYGVAWRTAIINHVGFINVASYNNWPDGSQIEEVMPKSGFLDYSPGSKTKYLELTTHWMGNFIRARREAANTISAGGGGLSCYELLNNTIC